MSIRLRLTLWQTALLALVLAAFAAVVYVVVARQETSRLDAALQDETEAVERAFLATHHAGGERGGADERSRSKDAPGPSPGRPDLDPDPDLPDPVVDAAITAALDNGALVAEVIDPDGRERARTTNLARPLPAPAGTLRRARDGERVLATMEIDGELWRLNAETGPPGRGGHPPDVLLVASPLQPLAATLTRWRLVLAAAVLGATALSAAVGWFLASQAMRPVDRMNRAAAAIGHSADLSRRLPEPDQRDELGRLALTFNEMLGQLGEAFTAQRRFLADASHELRTPLTTVRANVDTLRRGAVADPAARDETLLATAREADRMARLVADLLALARADAGQPLACQRLALDTLVLDVYGQGRTLADGVRLELGEWEQVAVEGDPDRPKQVALNLLDNALRHTPSGGAVTLDPLRAGDEAVLRVRDTGPGIAPEHLDRIFERFYRVDRTRSRAAGGTGLGLAIAREVAEAHGGRIAVESRPGAGSVFSLVLPLAPAPPVAAETPARAIPAPQAGTLPAR